MNKLILGTAQLNERYGVLNLKKKTKQEIFQFLEYCFDKGIKNYDTAEGYNNQKLLGEFFKFNKKSVKPIVLTKIGKLNHRGRSNKKKLDLLKIKLDKIIKDLSVIPNTVLFHDIGDNIFFQRNYDKIMNIANDFQIKNFGSSIYELSDLKNLKNLSNITLQVPLNPANMKFNYLKKKKYKVIARSIFLQGLLINLNLKKLPKTLKQTYKSYVQYINANNINPLDLCMNFIKSQNINNFIVGADNIKQIEKIINFKKMKVDYKHIKNINNIFSKKTNDPRKWY